jgi:hypothetical protein
MTDKQQQWDQILGEKLRQLRPDYRAGSWEALSDRLEEAETTEADAAISAKFAELAPAYSADSWETLATRLDAEEAAFDAEVTTAMEQLRPAYQSASWAALAARLELEAYRRISVWQTKSLELMTVFVLLLAFWVFYPYLQQGSAISPVAAAQQRAQDMPAFRNAGAAGSPTASAALATAMVTTDSEASAASGETPPTDLKADNLTVKTTDGRSAAGPRNRANTAGQQTSLPKTLYRPGVDRLPFGQPAANLASETAQRNLPPLAVTPAPAAVAMLVSPEMNPFATQTETPTVARKLRRQRGPLVRSWGVIGTHWDQNVVFTPSFVLQRPFPSTTRLSRGSSIGLTYSFGRGRHRWETGAIYRLKQYFPSYVVLTDARERTVNRMRYHSVSIPFSYQYAFLRAGRWSTYLNVGASFNTTLAAHIDIEDIYLNSLNDPAGPRSEEARRAENFGEHYGLLQGGKLSNNATIYTLLGAGLEYRWPSGLSLFVQPTVTRRIVDFGQDGEGPLRERINSNSVLFGFKREF